MLNAKNNSKISKTSGLLIALTAFLVILYCLSFTKSCSSKDTREKIKTALVNQKYQNTISLINLQDATGSLELNNYNGFWTLQRLSDYTSSQLPTPPSIPVSQERINSLLNELIKVRNLYKISDKISQNSSFGLTNGTEFHLRYYLDDSFHELIFGNQDFSLSSRYMMTEKSTQVYETDNSLDTFLTTSVQSWAEPFLISQTVLGKITAQDIQRTQVQSKNTQPHVSTISDVQKLLDLRHGGIPDIQDLVFLQPEYAQIPEMVITLELGNKNEIELQVYKSASNNEFIVLTNYKTDKAEAPFFTSSAKISNWTYNKIKEITL